MGRLEEQTNAAVAKNSYEPIDECAAKRAPAAGEHSHPGDAVWLGTYANWQIARRAYDQGQAALAELGATVTGKEWILPVTADKTTRQAAFIADLVPAEAQRLCESYRSRKLFCQVVKPQDIVAPFGTFWH